VDTSAFPDTYLAVETEMALAERLALLAIVDSSRCGKSLTALTVRDFPVTANRRQQLKSQVMTTRGKNENDMPDVPEPDFVGALCEIWATINYAAYHLAYVQVYLQTAALQTQIEEMHRQDQAFRDVSQIDLHVCRAHLAALFWQVDHVFEALRIAINKGQKEHAEKEYFWSWGKSLEKIEASPIYKEINAYRNKSHEFPAIIGNKWINDATGHPVFVHHFLPTIAGHEAKEDIKLVDQLQNYFEFAANVWLSFSPGDFKDKFPRNFRFTVTVPYTYLGELPPELYGVPQFEVHVVAQDPPPGDPPNAEAAAAEKDEGAK
jgi:hypothetical protein